MVEKLRETHEKELSESRTQLESHKEKSLAHETYMKKVFEECLSNKDRLMSDLKAQHSQTEAQLLEEQRKFEAAYSQGMELMTRLKEANELVAEKDASIAEVSEHLLVLKDEVERMKNIYEQKIEERENNYNDFIDKKNEELDAYELHVKRLQAQIADINAQADGATQDAHDKDRQVRELRAVIQNLGISAGFKSDSLQEIAEAVSKACSGKPQASESAESLQCTVGDLSAQVESLSAQVESLTAQLCSERSRKAELSESLGRVEAQLCSCQSHWESLQLQLQKRIV